MRESPSVEFADVSYALEIRSSAHAGLFRAWNDSVVSAMPFTRSLSRVTAIKWRVSHKYKSYGIAFCCSSMLLAAATLGNSCPPMPGPKLPHNAAKFGLAKRCTADRLHASPPRDVSCSPDEKKKPFLVAVALPAVFLSFFPFFVFPVVPRLRSRDISVRVRFLYGDSNGGRSMPDTSEARSIPWISARYRDR